MSYGHVHRRVAAEAAPVVVQFQREVNLLQAASSYALPLQRTRSGQPWTRGELVVHASVIGPDGGDGYYGFGFSGGLVAPPQSLRFADGESVAWLQLQDLFYGNPVDYPEWEYFPHYVLCSISEGPAHVVGPRGNGEFPVYAVALPPPGH
ncbi:hypothetical protein D0B54_17970 [Solimonas sp. K1W22B-7]|uniref:hypothetical protein n=1 Tax=Solimonas sp. K1W22B-7 TaxID=2303331 RepID=UPI000E3341B5|nr:hypothetical protein [Solimonas sp. K1W22B-7]AXQ30448.1 hypothetical protein D0B54_17970 [Solimonas sp. K1W22B-7]